MIPDLLLAAVLGLVVVLAIVVLTVLLRDRARTSAELAAAHAEAAALRARVDALAVQVVAARREPQEFVITHLGEDEDEPLAPSVPTRIDGKLFADLVLRETVVKAAALGHGVRRAVAPEVRNRVRFEMRREVKRSRKARKDEFRQVRQEMRDRQRAAEATA